MTETGLDESYNRYRILATAAAFFGTFSLAVVYSVTPASINEIGRAFGASKSMLGALYFAQMAAFALSVTIGGWLSDRKGKLPVMMMGCLLMAVGSSAFALTSNFSVAFALMLLTGLGGGFTEGVAIAAVADLYSGARRTALMNWTQALFGLGAIGTPLVVAKLISMPPIWRMGNWRLGYFLAALCVTTAAALAAIAISRKREVPIAVGDKDTADWRTLLRDPLVIWLAIGIGLYVGAESGQGNWLAVYFEKGLNSTAPFAASTIAFFWSGISVGRIAAVWLSRHMSDHALILWSLGLCVAAEAGMLLMPTPVPAVAMVTVVGLCMGPVWPTVLSRAAAAHPGQSGTVIGIIIALGAAALAIVSPVIGGVGDIAGIRPAMWICFVLVVLNLALFLRLDAEDTRKGRS